MEMNHAFASCATRVTKKMCGGRAGTCNDLGASIGVVWKIDWESRCCRRIFSVEEEVCQGIHRCCSSCKNSSSFTHGETPQP